MLNGRQATQHNIYISTCQGKSSLQAQGGSNQALTSSGVQNFCWLLQGIASLVTMSEKQTLKEDKHQGLGLFKQEQRVYKNAIPIYGAVNSHALHLQSSQLTCIARETHMFSI